MNGKLKGKLKGNESVLPPITVLAEQIRDGVTVEDICDEYSVSRSTLQGRFSTAGFTMSTGEALPKRGGDHQPLESVSLGTGGVYIGGRDWDRGLPTPEAPARHQPRAKHTGLPWDQINADYTARGGQVDADVWPDAGKVTISGSNGMTRHRVHTWSESVDYSEPAPAATLQQAQANAARKRNQPGAKLNQEQRVTIGRRYQDGESLPELAKDYGVSVTTVSNTLKAIGISTRTRQAAGEVRRSRKVAS
jgi:uncharacterized protein (DUF433 family)